MSKNVIESAVDDFSTKHRKESADRKTPDYVNDIHKTQYFYPNVFYDFSLISGQYFAIVFVEGPTHDSAEKKARVLGSAVYMIPVYQWDEFVLLQIGVYSSQSSMTSKMSHNFRILGDESTGHLLESLN
jgi:hypothetical protein